MEKKKLIGERSLVFDWNRSAAVLLYGWCLLPVLKAAGNLISFQTGKAIYLCAFYLLGISGIILALFKLMDGITVEKAGYFRHFLRERKCDLFFAAFLLWALVACLLSGDFSRAVSGSSYRGEGLAALLFYAAIYLNGRMLTRHETKLRLLYTFIASAALSALIAVSGALPALASSSSLALISLRYMFGSAGFDSFVQLGDYLFIAFTVSCSLYLNTDSAGRRITALAIALICAAACAVCGIYLPIYMMLAAAVVLSALFMVKRRKFILRALAPAAAMLAVCVILLAAGKPLLDNTVFTRVVNELDSELTTTGRGELLSQSLKLTAKKPVFGYGFDSMTGYYYDGDGAPVYHDRPQCEYIRVAMSYGIPALALLLCGFAFLLAEAAGKKTNRRSAERAAVVGLAAFLFAGLVCSSAAPVTVYLAFMAGMCVNTGESCTDGQKESSAPDASRLNTEEKAPSGG